MHPALCALSERVPVGPCNGVALQQYLAAIAAGFCPYLRPAMDAGCLYLTQYEIPQEAFSVPEDPAVFITARTLLHVEWLRLSRRRLDLRGGRLLRDNVAFDTARSLTAEDWESLFAWPHFIAKCIYSEAAVMIGKFWPGERARTRDEREVPAPPQSFLSIRSTFPTRDPDLLREKTPTFAEVVATARDDNKDVLHRLGIDLYTLLDGCRPARTGYRRLKRWASTMIPGSRNPYESSPYERR